MAGFGTLNRQKMGGSDAIELFNLQDQTQLVSPCLTVHGTCKNATGARMIQVLHPQLPRLSYPLNESGFKATIILTPGENRLTFATDTNKSKTVTCYYTPLLQDPPIHLCLLVAKDSPLEFDSPKVQRDKEGGNGLDLAVKKLRVGARLMQAYTNEQMMRAGFGNRTFRFLEEFTWDTTFQQRSEMRNTVKIHILRSDKSTKEIRDANLAQQNPNASDAGGLFGVAMDALQKYGGPFADRVKPVQAAVMFLDTHWDGNLITAHAALGGGTDEVKLAIFGSHALFAWPPHLEQLVEYFTDETRTSKKEVANDCDECGTHWEAFTLTLGAFLHEIGHSLGCPHEESGVMLRDYTTLNRSFVTREAFSIRTNSYGAKSPIYPKEECTWHRLDLVRFLYHPSFTLPQDYLDPSFLRPGEIDKFTEPKPSIHALGDDLCRITSRTGVYLIEIVCGDLTKAYIEYLPVSLGGPGPQHDLTLSLSELRSLIPPNEMPEHGNSFGLKLLSVNAPGLEIGKFPDFLKVTFIPMDQYGFPRGVQGVKSQLLGNPSGGQDVGIVPIDIRRVTAVRIYHGGALDGMRFYFSSQTESANPPVPPRNYLGKLVKSFKATSIDNTSGKNVLFGYETGSYTDAVLEEGEYITGFNVRCGGWIDALQIVTNEGRVTKMLGNEGGGGLIELRPPEGQYILGLYGNVGQWVDAMGIIYGRL